MLDNIPYQGCMIEYNNKKWEVIQESTEYEHIWCIPKGTEFTEESGSTDLYKELLDGTAKVTDWPDMKPPQKPKEKEKPATIQQAKAKQIIKRVTSVKQLAKDGIPEVKWIIDNILPEQGLLIIGGESGSYKTYFAQHTALCMSRGRKVLDKFGVKLSKVLYIDHENNQYRLLKRFDQLRKGHKEKEFPEELYMVTDTGIHLDNRNEKEILQQVIEEFNPDVVIIDSMVRFMEGDEDKSKDVRKVFEHLKELMEEHNVSFIVLHHTRKDTRGGHKDGLRGSGDFGAMADCVLMLNSLTNPPGAKVFMSKNRNVREDTFTAFRIIVDNPGEDQNAAVRLSFDGVVPEYISKEELAEKEIKSWVMNKNLESFKRKDAIEEFSTANNLGISRFSISDVDRALKNLVECGEYLKPKPGFYETNLKSLSNTKSDLTKSGEFIDDKKFVNPHLTKKNNLTIGNIDETKEQGGDNTPDTLSTSTLIDKVDKLTNFSDTKKHSRREIPKNDGKKFVKPIFEKMSKNTLIPKSSKKPIKNTLIPKSSNLSNLKEYFKNQNEPTTKKDLEKIGFSNKVIDRGIPMLLRSGDIMESKPGEYRKT